MKITKEMLKELIKEELDGAINEKKKMHPMIPIMQQIIRLQQKLDKMQMFEADHLDRNLSSKGPGPDGYYVNVRKKDYAEKFEHMRAERSELAYQIEQLAEKIGEYYR